MSNNDDHPILQHAPIIEAVFDIQCRSDSHLNSDDIKQKAINLLNQSYPHVRNEYILEQQIQSSDQKSYELTVNEELKGFRFISDDKLQLIQFRRDGISFNRLAPYSAFEDYLPIVKSNWKIYYDITSPVEITRIAQRFINKINIPLNDGSVDLERYLKVVPKLVNEKKFILTGFLNQVQITDNDKLYSANVTITNHKTIKGLLPIILDIDVYYKHRFDSSSIDFWQHFENLRVFKNKIFYDSLTEECLELFK